MSTLFNKFPNSVRSYKLNISALQTQAKDEQTRITREYLSEPRPSGSGERISAIRVDLQQAMESGAGIYRDEASLKQTCEILVRLRERTRNIRLDDRSNCFNTELTAALELEYMLDIAEALAHSALARTESRGSHQRTDYPDRNDKTFLKHTLAYRTEEGPPRIDYLDVTITNWPPAERVYGEKPVKATAKK